MQIVIDEMTLSHATIDEQGKTHLERFENQFQGVRRARLAIWRTKGLTAADMLERLVALISDTPR